MINPEVTKRLQLFSKDLYGSVFDYEPFEDNLPEGAKKGLPKRKKSADFYNLIFALIRNDFYFSKQFWSSYVYASVASTKLNTTLSLENICKLIEITQNNLKQSNKEEDEDLLINLLEFISNNSLLSSSDPFITSVNEMPMAATQTIDNKFFEESILKGRNLLMNSMCLLYGIASPKSTLPSSSATRKQMTSLLKNGLIESVNESYFLESDKSVLEVIEDSKDEPSVISTLEHGVLLVETELMLRIFKNRMAYVRVNTFGEYLPNFSELWEFETIRNKANKNIIKKFISKEKRPISGKEAYKGIIDSIEHLQSSLNARSDLCWNKSVSLENLRLVAGLDNVKSIKNELTQKESLLDIAKKEEGQVTLESAFKWLNDSKRRKARFYNFLTEYASPSLEDIKEIYLSEINSY